MANEDSLLVLQIGPDVSGIGKTEVGSLRASKTTAGPTTWAREGLPIGNVAPGQTLSIGGSAKTERPEEVSARWGLVPYWLKEEKIGDRCINVRAESVAKAPAFRGASQDQAPLWCRLRLPSGCDMKSHSTAPCLTCGAPSGSGGSIGCIDALCPPWDHRRPGRITDETINLHAYNFDRTRYDGRGMSLSALTEPSLQNVDCPWGSASLMRGAAERGVSTGHALRRWTWFSGMYRKLRVLRAGEMMTLQRDPASKRGDHAVTAMQRGSGCRETALKELLQRKY